MGFALAVGAVRVAAIRSGRISLAEHEAVAGRAPGGHTIERHIGKTSDELQARLARRTVLGEVSSFKSTRDAEQLISKLLNDNKNQIQMWVKHLPPGLNAKMELERVFAHQTGILVSRGTTNVTACYKVRVVIRFQQWQGKPYFVLTAFPKA